MGVAHHICIYKGCDGSLVKEWASVESLLFDHKVVEKLVGGRGERVTEVLLSLVRCKPSLRLKQAEHLFLEREEN